MDFPGGRNRHGIAQPLGEFAGVQRAEDAAGGVGVQITQICGQVEIPPQLTGLSDGALLHRFHGGGQNGSGGKGHQERRVGVRDPVPQSAEGAAFRVVIRHGADAGHAVPNPGPNAVGALLVLFRGNRERHAPAFPADLQVGGRLPILLEQGLELL